MPPKPKFAISVVNNASTSPGVLLSTRSSWARTPSAASSEYTPSAISAMMLATIPSPSVGSVEVRLPSTVVKVSIAARYSAISACNAKSPTVVSSITGGVVSRSIVGSIPKPNSVFTSVCALANSANKSASVIVGEPTVVWAKALACSSTSEVNGDA